MSESEERLFELRKQLDNVPKLAGAFEQLLASLGEKATSYLTVPMLQRSLASSTDEMADVMTLCTILVSREFLEMKFEWICAADDEASDDDDIEEFVEIQPEEVHRWLAGDLTGLPDLPQAATTWQDCVSVFFRGTTLLHAALRAE